MGKVCFYTHIRILMTSNQRYTIDVSENMPLQLYIQIVDKTAENNGL